MEQGPPDVDVETHEIAGAMGKSFSGVFEYAHMCRKCIKIKLNCIYKQHIHMYMYVARKICAHWHLTPKSSVHPSHS